MQKYVLINRVDGVREYGILTISSYLINDIDDVEIFYDLCYTDNINDATKFTCIGTAFDMVGKVCNFPEDWDVLPYMEEK